jgi:hypothetical protein
MKRIRVLAILVVVTLPGAWTTPANAAPPTVVPSPGYDARLQEQRAQIAHEALERNSQPPMLHRGKRHHGGVH